MSHAMLCVVVTCIASFTNPSVVASDIHCMNSCCNAAAAYVGGVYVNDDVVDDGETEGDVVGEWWMER